MSTTPEIEPDSLTFGAAWDIQHTVGPSLDHDPKCSSVPGHHPLSGPALLCDCGAVEREWERRRVPVELRKFVGTRIEERPTSETDALAADPNLRSTNVLWTHARNLERERDEAREAFNAQVAAWYEAVEQRNALAALVGTIRQWFDIPLRNVSDLTPEGHSREIGEAVETLKRQRDEWKANHDNQVELKRIITSRPDLKERAPLVERLASERNTLLTAAKNLLPFLPDVEPLGSAINVAMWELRELVESLDS